MLFSATFSPSCGDVIVYSLLSGQFTQREKQFYSSVFLQSITPGPYAIVQNDNGIIVGQLVGDGVVIQLQNTKVYNTHSIFFFLHS